jgi:putative transposase
VGQVQERLPKNQRIARTRLQTLQRHRSMLCRTYELKVDRSHLSEGTLETLRRLFLEAKWFYNDLVARGNVFRADYKVTAVRVRNREKKFETRELQCLSSQMRQEIIDRAKDSIRGLARLRKNGCKVGALGFKSRVRSIPLKQYGVTYKICGGRIEVQNVRQQMRVRGLDQIPEGVEFVNATLEQRHGDYFLHVTTYQQPVGHVVPGKAIGVDAGVRHQLTLSNGVQIDEGVLDTKKVRRLHRELSRRESHGRNWYRTNKKLNKEHDRIANQRTDIRNKIVSKLVSTYDSVAVQDDNIAGWQRIWGRRVSTSAIGGIMSDLKSKPRTPVVVDRFEPTTRRCSQCGTLNDFALEERVYRCARCGLIIDRDLNSAINEWKAVPAERREFTPVDTKAAIELLGYFNSIPNVSASLVEEAGSHPTLSRW